MKITYQQFKEIKEKYNGQPNVFHHWLKKNYSDLYDDIVKNGDFYKEHSCGLSHKIIWYFCNISSYPICPVCGKENRMLPNTKLIEDYIKQPIILYYCKNHYYSSDYYQNKMKDFYLKKYGVDNPNKLQTVKDKVQRTLQIHYGPEKLKNETIRNKKKQTNLERYGVEYNAQAETVKRKIKETFNRLYNGHPLKDITIYNKLKQTNQDRYGVQFASQNLAIREKIRQTNLLHYGVPVPTQSEIVKNKTRNTNLIRYGTEVVTRNPEVRKKVYDTTFKHYGTKYSFQADEVKSKIKKTLQLRYNITNVSQNKEIHSKQVKSIIETRRRKSYQNILNNEKVQLVSTETEYYEYFDHKDKLLKWRCKLCGKEFTRKIDWNWRYLARCYDCFPRLKSKAESEIFDFLNSMIQVDRNRRDILSGGKELDLYIPEKNLAIEYDGLYWHSTEFHLDVNYHLNKTLDCESKNIRLIHIFEDEWLNKQEIVKSRLCDILGKYKYKIFARKCNIKEITFEESKIFLNNNHIQGSCRSKIQLGLFYNNELISLMTFGGYRKALGRNKIENEYEMLRFCNKLGYHIPGAASKLLTYFERKYNPKKVISYADRRWSQGKLYQALNFSFIRYTDSNYYYIIGDKREYRFKWRKSELPKLLSDVDMSKTEERIMEDHNYYRIYDCGNLLYEKIY